MKPVEYYDFALRLDRALRIVRRGRAEKVTVVTRDGMRIFPISELVFVDILGHDLSYHLANGEIVSLRGSLTKAAGQLPEESFVRISNSCLVNMGHICAVQRDCVRVTTGESLFFSRPKHKAALASITDYLGGSF